MTLVAPIAHFVVALTVDGRISSQGSLQSAIQKDDHLLDAEKADESSVDDTKKQMQTQKTETDGADGKLIAEEDVLEGHVGWQACKYPCTSLSISF